MKYALYLFTIILFSCSKEKQGLYLENNSADTIYYAWDYIDSLYAGTEYPLTPISQKIEDYMGSGKTMIITGITGLKVLPDSSTRIVGGGLIEYGFRGSSAEFELERNGGYITIFVFDKAFLENHPWNAVIEKQLCTNKYRFSIAELKSLNWKVTYP